MIKLAIVQAQQVLRSWMQTQTHGYCTVLTQEEAVKLLLHRNALYLLACIFKIMNPNFTELRQQLCVPHFAMLKVANISKTDALHTVQNYVSWWRHSSLHWNKTYKKQFFNEHKTKPQMHINTRHAHDNHSVLGQAQAEFKVAAFPHFNFQRKKKQQKQIPARAR